MALAALRLSGLERKLPCPKPQPFDLMTIFDSFRNHGNTEFGGGSTGQRSEAARQFPSFY